jgi:hypothetical protein
MTTLPAPSNEGQENGKQPRDASYWAQDGLNLKVKQAPMGALNLNVEGRNAVGPLQGFGSMWQKTYRVRLQKTTVQPTEVIKTWKEQFPNFWPAGNRFYGPITGIAPGEVALLNLAMPGGMTLSTGVLVLYADEESFTPMTPQGHMFAGWITFSAFEEDGVTVVQVQVLVRANDPIYEVGMRFGGFKSEDVFWQHTLRSLSTHFGIDGIVETQIVCVDPRFQWAFVGNVWHNAAMRTAMYSITAPVRWLHSRINGGSR